MVRGNVRRPRPGSGLGEIYSVSRLTEAARATLESGLGYLWVEGEISNLARPASGHLYFTLKDATAQVRCAMFRNRASGLRCRPENGLAVLVHGLVSVYPARGDFQLVVEALEAAGDGLLALRFEQLKRKLDLEGLFDVARKRPLPRWPRAVGVVTSPSGAAVRDIITVLARRCPMLPIVVYPSAVQGDAAAAEIVRAIERANARAECDVLIVGRGGGSLEDLWPFNEQSVARAVYASAIPVVSAVGHEVDVSICDLVADVRAPTPSAAAELVSPDVAAARSRVAELRRRLAAHLDYQLRARRRELARLCRRLVSPQRRVQMNQQRIDELSQRLAHAIAVHLERRQGRLATLCSRAGGVSPAARVRLAQREIGYLQRRLASAARELLAHRAQRLERHREVLQALGPAATLARGYAIVTDDAGRIVRDGATLRAGQDVHARLARGGFAARVGRIDAEPAPAAARPHEDEGGS